MEAIAAFSPRLFISCPLVVAPVAAGFPSPAEDYVERSLDLNECLVQHQEATFFVRARGSSMVGVGIHDGDTLVVDRALEPADGQIVIALVDGEFTVKRLRRAEGRVFLVAENPHYRALEVTPGQRFEVWGVVTYVIHPI
uniref:Error-prone repair protein UmuD n=1 Tax=uncultured Armatimonadetes bacterium TaxID=157466 RepID=A0A6J4HBD3_9BACT|nr:Error-prone repair protein UmuD [uncultured Armatimonadetes bacterium]